MIKTKSVHSPQSPSSDGLRILATRFRGHGLPVTRYDVWMPNLGPSETLLRAFQGGKISWAEFGRRYKRELFESGGIDQRKPLPSKTTVRSSHCACYSNWRGTAPSQSCATAPRINSTVIATS